MEHINLSTSLCTPKAVMLEQFQMRRRGGHAGIPVSDGRTDARG